MMDEAEWQLYNNFGWKIARTLTWNDTRFNSDCRCEELVDIAKDHILDPETRKKFNSDGKATFNTWAYKVMQNKMRDTLRKWRRDWNHKEPSKNYLDQNYADILSALLHLDSLQLTATERKIAEAIAFQRCLTNFEIAESTGIQSSGSLRSHKSHLKHKVKSLINNNLNANRVIDKDPLAKRRSA